jgi:serine phosphatase RsbU (regulator of sigma subunit)
MKDSEAQKDKTKKQHKKSVLDRARRRSIELFSEKLELKKEYNDILFLKNQIEAKNQQLEKAVDKAKSRTVELFGKHIDLKKAMKSIDEQKRLIENKNKELEDKNKTINESLAYAQLIQQAILPSTTFIERKFTDSFIFFNPKDIVSGDFYWYAEREHFHFFAEVDCTGHGVPGAMMSMIGNSLLNKIADNPKNNSPAAILKELNKEVGSALKQSYDANTNRQDGMDITICQVDNKKKEVTIAAGMQKFMVVIDNKPHFINGDRFSVGGLFSENSNLCFTNHTFPITQGLKVYMFSDGFADQFGGNRGKKFFTKNLKKLLEKHINLPMKEQKTIYEQHFNKWKGENTQVDDILLVGLEI